MVFVVETDDFFSWDSGNFTELYWSSFNSTLARDYWKWGSAILCVYLFICPFFGPFVVSLILYLSSFIIWINKKKTVNNLTYVAIDHQKTKMFISKIWAWVSFIWHGHELVGYDTTPKKSTIFIMYHGAMAIDASYLLMHFNAHCDATFHIISHYRQVSIRGWRDFHIFYQCNAYTREECVDLLNSGDNIMIAPGGMNESRFSDNKYRVHFAGRKGFAHVALASKATIIPVFTRNIREAFYIPWFIKPFVSSKYSPKNIPFLPAAGGLPVKLTTFFGPPIEYDDSYTPDQLANKVLNSLQELIDKHQRVPGNKFYALLDRFYYKPKEETVPNETQFAIV